jgi:hypothetical protein
MLCEKSFLCAKRDSGRRRCPADDYGTILNCERRRRGVPEAQESGWTSEDAFPARNKRRRRAEYLCGCQFALWQSDNGPVHGSRAYKSALRNHGHGAWNLPVDVPEIRPAEIRRPEISDFVIKVANIHIGGSV